jgi:hypothetical protein
MPQRSKQPPELDAARAGRVPIVRARQHRAVSASSLPMSGAARRRGRRRRRPSAQIHLAAGDEVPAATAFDRVARKHHDVEGLARLHALAASTPPTDWIADVAPDGFVGARQLGEDALGSPSTRSR